MAADAARQARDWPTAARHYRKAAQLAPGRAPIWIQLGHALKEHGDFAASEVAYRRAAVLAAGSIDTDASLHLGHLLKRLERFSEANACYAEVIERSPLGDTRIVDAHIGLADVLRDQRLWPASASEYAKALAEMPRMPLIWIQLGHALKESGRISDAEGAYRKAVRFDPTSTDGLIQLGHILERQGRRSEAVRCYREALSLDPVSADASQALLRAVGYSPDEVARGALEGSDRESADASSQTAITAFRALARRLDVIWFGNIEWNFRMQRPQHLASALAARGVGIVYVSMLFDSAATPSFRVISRPSERVLEVRLGFPDGEAADIHRGLSAEAVAMATGALESARAALGIASPTVVAQEPLWEAVLRSMPRQRLVYDCVDLLAAFDGAAPGRLDAEARMLASADVTIVTSAVLFDRLSDRRPILIRNGVNVDEFRRPPAPRTPGRARLGYFGAVREWFAFDWIGYCAARHPDWEFTIIGRQEVTIPEMARSSNIKFLGERPFDELADQLAGFDVALIPFRANALTVATNPVKLYEYLAGGKPVVATALPETRLAGDLVHLAEDARSFERGIIEALENDSTALAARRVAWAQQNSWNQRAGQLLSAID